MLCTLTASIIQCIWKSDALPELKWLIKTVYDFWVFPLFFILASAKNLQSFECNHISSLYRTNWRNKMIWKYLGGENKSRTGEKEKMTKSNPIQPLILRFLILLFNKTPTIDKSEQEYYKGRSWSPRQACQSNLTPDPTMSPHVSITTPPSSGTPPPPCQLHAFRPCYRKYPTPHMRPI